MRNQIVILAAGKGTRMDRGDIPKVLVMLKNKPLILYILEQIDRINQLAKPVIVVGYMADKVKAVLGSDYIYAFQDHQLGTAHALHCAKGKISGENILVLYGDMPFINSDSLRQLMRLHHSKSAIISMFTTTIPSFEGKFSNLKHYGRIIRNFAGKITKITEFKDASEKEKEIKELNPGIYMFNSAWLWDNIKKIKNKNAQGEYYLTDIIELAMQQGIEVNTLAINPQEVVGINSKLELETAEKI